MRQLQDVSDVRGKKESSYRPGHGADAGNRAHRAAREHIGSRGEQIGGESLVSGRGQTEQCAKKHGRHSRALWRKPHTDESRGQVAPVDAADGRGIINNQDGQSEPNKAQAKFVVEITRQPVEVEPPDGIGKELGNGICPCLAEAKQFDPRSGWTGLLWRVLVNVGEFGSGERGMFGGFVVFEKPQQDPRRGENAGDQKCGVPAKITPTLAPQLKMPKESERSSRGNHSALVLLAAGKLPDSPIPRQERAMPS